MYVAPSPQSRSATLLAIVALHAIALAAAASLGSTRITIEHPPMLVQMIAAPARAIEPPRAVPPPRLQAPELRLTYPAIEVEASPPPQVAATAMPSRPQPVAIASPPAKAESAPIAIEPPRHDMAYLENPPPAYPSLSRRTREEGRVLLRVRVDAEGHVEAVELQATSGHPRLDEAAIDAVRRWRFAPARAGDRRVAGWAVVPINFHLNG